MVPASRPSVSSRKLEWSCTPARAPGWSVCISRARMPPRWWARRHGRPRRPSRAGSTRRRHPGKPGPSPAVHPGARQRALEFGLPFLQEIPHVPFSRARAGRLSGGDASFFVRARTCPATAGDPSSGRAAATSRVVHALVAQSNRLIRWQSAAGTGRIVAMEDTSAVGSGPQTRRVRRRLSSERFRT